MAATIEYYVESGTIEGLIVCDTSGSLVGKEGYLVAIHTTATSDRRPTVVICDASKHPMFVVEEVLSTTMAVCRPLDPNRSVRIICAAAGVTAGDYVASDAAGLIVTAAGDGTYVVGIAENDGASGQYVSVRPQCGQLHA